MKKKEDKKQKIEEKILSKFEKIKKQRKEKFVEKVQKIDFKNKSVKKFWREILFSKKRNE